MSVTFADIEAAVLDPERLRSFVPLIHEDPELSAADREVMLGRIQRYLESMPEQGDEA